MLKSYSAKKYHTSFGKATKNTDIKIKQLVQRVHCLQEHKISIQCKKANSTSN